MARENPAKDTCLVVVLIGASLLAGLVFLLNEAARWLS